MLKKTATKVIMITLFSLLFFGCEYDFFNQKANAEATKEKLKNDKEISKLKIAADKEQALAQIQSDNTKAQLQQEKEIEKLRLEVELESKKLELSQKNSDSKLQHTALLNEQKLDLELQKYIFALLTLIILIIAIFAFVYFKHRREDKLRAYNDNLEKYFEHQQAQTRAKIAQKLLDTIATGKLDKEQERRLISVFNGEKIDDEKLSIEEKNNRDNEIEDVEIVQK